MLPRFPHPKVEEGSQLHLYIGGGQGGVDVAFSHNKAIGRA